MGVVSVYVIALPSIYVRMYVCGYAWGGCMCGGSICICDLPSPCMYVCMYVWYMYM